MTHLENLARQWLAGALLIAGIALATALTAGMLLPEQHQVSRRLTLSRTPEAVWRAITDSAFMAAWRSDLKLGERIADSAGLERWRETDRDGKVALLTVLEAQEPVHLRIRRETDRSVLEWEYVIRRAPAGVDLMVTQRGRIPGRAERFLSQFASGHAALLERYLEELAGFFDEPARISLVAGAAAEVPPARCQFRQFPGAGAGQPGCRAA